MGSVTIVIHATGAHHNNTNPTDLNKMAARFVDLLKKAGHSIEHASVTHGGREDVSPESNGPTRSGVYGTLSL